MADALGLGVHDHPVLDRRRARGLQLGDSLDLHQTHAAGADGVAEFGLITEVGDLDVAVLGGVDEHRALGREDLAAIDRQLNGLLLWTWHRFSVNGQRTLGPAARWACGLAAP